MRAVPPDRAHAVDRAEPARRLRDLWPMAGAEEGTVVIMSLTPEALSVAKRASACARTVVIGSPVRVPHLAIPCAELAALGVEFCDRETVDELEADITVLVAHLDVAPHEPLVRRVRDAGGLVTSIGDVVMTLSTAPTIGITGTAGKSTTTRLLQAMLNAADIAAMPPPSIRLGHSWPTGSVLDAVDTLRSDRWLALELTSAHLEYMNTSPHVAMITNLAASHHGFHGSAQAYVAAKETIVRHQRASDWTILNYDDSASPQFAALSRGRVAYFSLEHATPDGIYVAKNGLVTLRWNGTREQICAADEMRLRGAFAANGLAAAVGAVIAGVAPSIIRQTLLDFSGIPGRFEFLGTPRGVAVYSDAMATTPVKAVASIETLAHDRPVVITGGALRSPLEERVATPEEEEMVRRLCRALAHVARAVVAFGDGGSLVYKTLRERGFPQARLYQCSTLEDAVSSARDVVVVGATVLLAPGFYLTPDALEAAPHLLRAAIA